MHIGFEGFDVELEDFQLVKVRKMDRHLRFGEGGSVLATPRIHEGIVYFVSADNYIYSVDANTGKEKWRFKTHGAIFSTPVVSENTLFVGSYDKNLYCLNLDGKEMWRFSTGGKITSSPFVHENIVLIGSNDGYLYAVERDSGKEVWKFKTGDWISSSPVVCNEKIYIGSYDSNVYCLNLDGKEIWRFKMGAEMWGMHESPSVYKGILYFASMDGYLYAVNAETGKEKWKVMTGKYGNAIQPMVNSQFILHPSRDGILYAFDHNGKEIWRFNLGNLPNAPVVYKDRIFIGNESGTLRSLTPEGKEKWHFQTGGKIFGGVVAWKDKIYIPSYDCHVYCLNMEGEELWRFATSNLNMVNLPPPHDAFKLEIKKETHIEDIISEDKYESKNEQSVSLSNYHVESEYTTTSEYKQKSDYDTDFVIFGHDMEFFQFLNDSPNLLL
ncbi:MAG: PQQ-like beta-propeller repeat protein [Candidatus Aenigmarchaeota archaeon]|nr:PQQ-like beta-propeller repeat protein [Candidatus Aenigmarchaeota archaeon]